MNQLFLMMHLFLMNLKYLMKSLNQRYLLRHLSLVNLVNLMFLKN